MDKIIIAVFTGAVGLGSWLFGVWTTEKRSKEEAMKTILSTEGKKLGKEHEVGSLTSTTHLITDTLPNFQSGFSTISICSQTSHKPFSHEKFFLKLKETEDGSDSSWILCFSEEGDGRINLSQIFIPLKKTQTTHKTAKVTEFHIYRLNQILTATNFSYCLRNDEHLARFVMDGVWHSLQMQVGGTIRNVFDPIMTAKNKKRIATTPGNLRIKRNPGADGPLYDHEELEMIKFKKYITSDNFVLTERSFNVIIVGPTGSGKSSLINFLFNLGICEAKSQTAAVTRERDVIHGEFKCDDGVVIDVNVLDTMGLCDLFEEDENAVDDLCKAILNEKSKIDKIIVLTSGNISPAHCKAIEALKQKLHYSENKDFFIFIYNKTENEDDLKRIELVEEMGKVLNVDINHKIPIPVMNPNDEILESTRYIRAGFASGVDVSNINNAVSRKGIKKLKEALLPHTAKVLQSPKRMSGWEWSEMF